MGRPFSALTWRGQLGRLKPLAHAASRRWPLRSPEVRRLHYGENATYQVRDADGGRWVLRVARPGYQSQARIESELWYVTQLRRAGLAVPEPARGRDGQWVQTVSVPGVPEPRRCVLLRWMPGRFLYRGLRPVHAARLGETIARLHEASRDLSPPPGFTRARWDAAGMLGPGALWGDARDSPHLSAVDRAWVTDECARIRARLEAYGEGPDRFGLIHADLHFGNLVYHRGWPRLFDFDDCGRGFLAHDLIPALGFADFADKPFIREALLSGYASARPLPPDLDRLVPVLRQAHRLRAIGWLTTRSDNPRLAKVAAKRVPKILATAREKAAGLS